MHAIIPNYCYYSDTREIFTIRLGEPTYSLRRSIVVTESHFIVDPTAEAESKLKFPETEFRKIPVIFAGTTEGRGLDAVSG